MSSKKKQTQFEIQRAVTLTQGCIKPDTYEIDDRFRPGAITPSGVHTIPELVQLLEKDKSVGFEGLICVGTPDGKATGMRMGKEKFLEAYKSTSRKTNPRKALESFDRGFDGQGGNLVGQDYVPLLGGPFTRQLYLHDMLRMMSLAFYAYNHDPFAHALINITVDFTLGRGYRVDSKNKAKLALWRAFEKVNGLQEHMRELAHELSMYGEVLSHWLPNNAVFFAYQVTEVQLPPDGALPRVRLRDPSSCWEIITYPEDIKRVLAYAFVYPTQYQIYTTKDQGSSVPSSKFIMQQVPASEMMHFAVNKASNEKRGRSDIYPAFGYLKRLRDSIEYSVVALQKAAAWAMDTTIEGSPTDIENYVQDQQSKPTLAPAGSEFVHTAKIKREYLGNQSSVHGGSVSAFEWCLNAICASVQIPVSYLGTHLSGGQTRASALVGTEPVTKKFEARQLVYERILKEYWTRLMTMYGLDGEDCDVTFPELISQDRSAKIKDTAMSQELDVISHERMSTIIAQELQLTDYDYKTEQEVIANEKKEKLSASSDNILISPLTAKPKAPAAPAGGATPPPAKPSAVTKDEKAAIAQRDGS